MPSTTIYEPISGTDFSDYSGCQRIESQNGPQFCNDKNFSEINSSGK